MKNIFNGIANINGKLCNLNDASVPLSDRGLLFGHSIFETLLVHKGKIIDWNTHYERMKLSCEKSFIQIPKEHDLINEALKTVDENIKKSEQLYDKAQLRIIISGGNSFDFAIQRELNSLPPCNIYIICRNVSGPTKENYINGIKLKLVADLRSTGLVNIKSSSYLYSIIALENSRLDGFDDALYYNSNQIITESTTANFIWFDKNLNVYSAPFEGACLAGTTLSRLITGLKNFKISFDWKELNRAKIEELAGCAIISSIRGIVPVKQIENHHFDIQQFRTFFKSLNKALQSE